MPTGAKLTYTYDNYHNVKTAVSDEGVTYSFTYDDYGNNTQVSVGGTSKIIASASYSSDGNRMVSSTDANGKVTTYSYHANTNVLEWVKYPGDTDATRTEYLYDSMYRLINTQADVSTGTSLETEYQYTEDYVTKIETGTTAYEFLYPYLGLCAYIHVGNHQLARYIYKDETYRLSKAYYPSGEYERYTYDEQGRVISVQNDLGYTEYMYDNNGSLASVINSFTGRETTYYRDFIDRLVKYVEKDEHRIYTNAWRTVLPYGGKYGEQDVLRVAAMIYVDNPRLMGATLYTLLK